MHRSKINLLFAFERAAFHLNLFIFDLLLDPCWQHILHKSHAGQRTTLHLQVRRGSCILFAACSQHREHFPHFSHGFALHLQ